MECQAVSNHSASRILYWNDANQMRHIKSEIVYDVQCVPRGNQDQFCKYLYSQVQQYGVYVSLLKKTLSGLNMSL